MLIISAEGQHQGLESSVWDIPHLELLQLAGHQGLGLSQGCVAALNALVYLLHGGLAVLTAAGAAPEHEALGREGRERLGRKAPGDRDDHGVQQRLGGASIFAPLLRRDIRTLRPRMGKLSSVPRSVSWPSCCQLSGTCCLEGRVDGEAGGGSDEAKF